MSTADSDAESRPDWKPPAPTKKASKNVPPQQIIDKFWKKFTTKHPGKPFTVLPDNLYAKRAAVQASRKAVPSKNAVASYEQAAATCKAKVEKIVQECRRLNQKYKDPHFDIELDFMQWQWYQRTQDCLVALDEDHAHLRPMSVKRVEDIFDEPHFYIEGMTANDVRQGRDGDCWFMSSVCTLCNKEDLLEKVCVARDEKVGVYGFVFHRDGEWISEVIDDKLHLAKEDFHESFWERYNWLTIDMPNPDDEYRKVMQTGSKALYFAQCRDQNETWLPLLEKAYAKAHGDYGAIEGGWVGEGLEDLTGGVTSELFAADILDKDKFWADELMNVNKLFLFGLAQMGGTNPWGKKEWDGPWSDGSEEWTPDRMRRLDHQFGNDGVFWILCKDLLKHFQHIDRTRLFGPDWSITQHWTTVNVPWSVNYLDTHFRFCLSKASPVVIMLCQIDDRYFRGLTGQYYFQLQYRLHKDGEPDYIARSKPSYFMYRSVSTELNLEPGKYSVMIKITASRDKSKPTPEETVKKTCQTRPDKLMAVGLSYDLAHAKGRLEESEMEHKKCVQRERRDKRKAKAKKAFEAQRMEDKKEKLRRLRLEAKERAKKSRTSECEQDADNGIEISIKMGERTIKPTTLQGSDEALGTSKMVSHEGTKKQLKIMIEASDKVKGGKSGDLNTNSGIEQPADGGDKHAENTKQSLEGNNDGGGNKSDIRQNTEVKGVSTTESELENGKESSTSTFGLTPAASAESVSAAEDSNEAEGQASANLVGGAVAGRKIIDTKSTSEPGGNADKSTAVDSDVHPQNPTLNGKSDHGPSWSKDIDVPSDGPAKPDLQHLTLDDISDDGLSWSSDVDVPSDSESEHDSDSDTDEPASPPTDPSQSSEQPADDVANDPWNAVCVFGLRVYTKGSQAEIEVVRKQDDGESVESKKLDVDDQAADATKKLQKGRPGEEKQLETVGSAPAWNEESKQG